MNRHPKLGDGWTPREIAAEMRAYANGGSAADPQVLKHWAECLDEAMRLIGSVEEELVMSEGLRFERFFNPHHPESQHGLILQLMGE
jgi:hypothetical protein